ncbi:hypothetical protein Tco_1570524 [Tanacetum coccineum]
MVPEVDPDCKGKGYRVIGLWGKVRGELGEMSKDAIPWSLDDSCWKGYRGRVSGERVWVSYESVLGRWFGLENSGRGSSGSGLTADSSVLTLTLTFLDFGLDFAQSFQFQLSSGSGLTADSSVLTLTLTFLDFGLDFAQSFPFHAQFCHFGLCMTRSSTKELLSPFENPEQKFCSRKRLFDTPSLVESNSPKFDHNFDIKKQSEEEVRETMMETMEQYMSKTRENYRSGVTRPTINQDTPFEFKGQFLKQLRDNTFSGLEHEDTNKHIEKVLEIADLFHILKVTQDQIMLRAFLVSLIGAEVILFYNGLDVPTRQILDSKGVIPSKTAADAKIAIQEMAKYSQKWHNGTSSRTRSTETSDGLAAIQAQLNNLRREIKKVNEKVYAAQFGAPYQPEGEYRAAGPGFYQRNNGNSLYPDRRPSLEESLTKFMAESAKRYRCARTELITPDLTCPSTHQLLRNFGGDSGPDLSFDKSASLDRLSGLARVSLAEASKLDLSFGWSGGDYTSSMFQVNTKFLNALPPEWSKFVTDVKLAKSLYTTNNDQLYAYLSQHERYANESPQHTGSSMYPPPQQFTPVYAAPIHHQHHHTPINTQQQSSVSPQQFISPPVTQQSQAEFPQLDYGLAVPIFQQGEDSIDYIKNSMAFLSAVTSRFPPSNNQLRTSSNPRNQATIQDGRVTVQQNSPFQTEDLDAYDSDCDDISSAKAVLMANISSCYSDVLSEVTYSDTYLNAMINQDVQEMPYSEQIHIVDFLDNEITSDSNIIPYSQYLQESQNTSIQDTNSFAPTDLLVLSLVEQMTNHVANLDKENQTNKMVNESLTAELERYKERIAIFEQRQNEIDTLKETLSNQVKEKESLSTTLTVFKTESKEKESKYIDRKIVLENQNKEQENILYKLYRSTQAMHMLTKPQVFYDNTHKQALGYQNLFHPKKAQRIKPTLYDGSVIAKEHWKRIFKKRTRRKPKTNKTKHGMEKTKSNRSQKARISLIMFEFYSFLLADSAMNLVSDSSRLGLRSGYEEFPLFHW